MRKSLWIIPVLLMVAGSSAEADSFSYSGAVVDYAVPVTGIYDITAAGAQGGSGLNANGGLGTLIDGNVFLTAGTVLGIAVGGQGLTGNFGTKYGGGGGGGTFVYVLGAINPLIVAGGGGGAAFSGSGPGLTGENGQTGTAGLAGDGPGGGAGGTNGMGGGGGTGLSGRENGGGGGGWLGNGGNGLGSGPSAPGGSGDGGLGAFSFLGGVGDGGDGAPGQAAAGGCGGGGGGGYQGGGGGGGFSGGGGGDGTTFAGGGGGSYVDLSVLLNTLEAGANSDNGYVTIIGSTPVPEPSTYSLMLIGLGLLGLIGKRLAPAFR